MISIMRKDGSKPKSERKIERSSLDFYFDSIVWRNSEVEKIPYWDIAKRLTEFLSRR